MLLLIDCFGLVCVLVSVILNYIQPHEPTYFEISRHSK
ncbi:hypothetical protein HOQ51_gp41 [uncultured phage_MedDCM-OCT-S35-C6]|nr:hypothetical protein HOQ51_gp41 [uncultured phage_MedDCM-OCT-S35-C6]